MTGHNGQMDDGRGSAPGWTVLAITTGLAAVTGGAISGLIVDSQQDPAPVAPRTVSIGSPSSASSTTPVRRSSGSIAAVAGRILPSVVSIEVRTATGGDTGSGIVISNDGYVLTNNHVIADAVGGDAKLSVVFPDKQTVDGEIVGRDTVSDLAVVRVHGVKDLHAASLGQSEAVAVGDVVVAVGSPLGLAGTVTSGIVSALDRPVEAGDAAGNSDNIIDAIQTDAAINPGNSGGPLVNDTGEVIGVNSAIATLSGGVPFDSGQGGNIGLGFAIPIDQAQRIAEQIIRQGYATHAIIGVRLDPSFEGNGAKIGDPRGGSGVVPGGPAAAAGLHDGDLVVAVDGLPVTNADELIVEIRKRLPGQHVTLAFTRDGDRQHLVVTLGSERSD